MKRKYLFIFGIICLLLAYAYYQMYVLPTDMKVGEEAPNFRCNSGVELNSLKGQYVLLDFWGSWCGPCRKQNPKIVDLYENFNGAEFNDAQGFEIVSVALENDSIAWRKAVEEDGLTWTYHCLELDRMDSKIAKQYDVRSIPTNFLINPAGQIVGINMTKRETERFLQRKMTK